MWLLSLINIITICIQAWELIAINPVIKYNYLYLLYDFWFNKYSKLLFFKREKKNYEPLKNPTASVLINIGIK